MINGQKIDLIIKKLTNAKKIALICHVNPDGDTVGSALALYSALSNCGNDVQVFCADPIGFKLQTLPNADKINIYNPQATPDISATEPLDFDVAVALDCAEKGRLGAYFELYKSAGYKICIDHHKGNTLVADCAIVDISSCATAEIVFDVIEKLPPHCFKKDVAACIYAGILTDSGCFTFSSVSHKTHIIAGKLLSCGIDAAAIAYDVFSKRSKSAFLLVRNALNRTRFFHDNTIALTTFFLKDFEETGATVDQTEGAVNELRNIDGVAVAITMTQTPDNLYRVSIRSKEPVSAADIAGVFGGGGHKLAAGCKLGGAYEDIVEKLVKAAGDRI